MKDEKQCVGEGAMVRGDRNEGNVRSMKGEAESRKKVKLFSVDAAWNCVLAVGNVKNSNGNDRSLIAVYEPYW